jgi:hypothetical protein
MRRSATALACAALMASVACGKSDNTTSATEQGNTPATTGTSASANNAEQQPQQVTYEGCLQKGAGMFGTDYLLTMLNEPPGVAGTSGSITATGSSVEREQMRIAAETYRLDSKGDVKLGDMVGKRVRVSGVISEKADVPNGAGPIGSGLDTQLPNRDRASQDASGPELNTSDLAKIDVSSATVIAPSCGERAGQNNGRTNPAMAGTEQGARVLR